MTKIMSNEYFFSWNKKKNNSRFSTANALKFKIFDQWYQTSYTSWHTLFNCYYTTVDEWILTYLIHSPKDRSNIVPTLGFEPWIPYTLSGFLIYCAKWSDHYFLISYHIIQEYRNHWSSNRREIHFHRWALVSGRSTWRKSRMLASRSRCSRT